MQSLRQTVMIASAVVGLSSAAMAQSKPLEVGSVAPDFTLTSATKDGVQSKVKLSDLKGQIVVLAFFPKARTSGCTVQNDAYRDKYNELFLGGKVKLFSISVDTPEELASWAKDRNYPHTFLSDAGGAVGMQYGAYKEQYKLDMRLLYVVGPDGKITYRANPFREVDPTAYTELGDALMKTGHAGMSHGGMTKGE